jgi:hypothetical protein
MSIDTILYIELECSYIEQWGRREPAMTEKEKLEKACKDFSSLSGDKQDYILGILQALVFACDENKAVQAEPLNNEGEGDEK